MVNMNINKKLIIGIVIVAAVASAGIITAVAISRLSNNDLLSSAMLLQRKLNHPLSKTGLFYKLPKTVPTSIKKPCLKGVDICIFSKHISKQISSNILGIASNVSRILRMSSRDSGIKALL